MKIVHVTSSDPAGSAYNFIQAINHWTPHTARLITTVYLPGLMFPKDIHDIYDQGDEIEALLSEADVIHLHKVTEDFTIEFQVGETGGLRRFCVKDFIKPGKTKVVYHIHGHPAERNFPEENANDYKKRNATVLASTPDLEELYRKFYPNVRYFPNCVPIRDVRYLPRASHGPMVGSDGSKRYMVCQSATNAILKNVHVIAEVMDELAKELPIFFLRIGPNPVIPQDAALRHKRNAAVIFDHIEGYYGLASLEGLSMGKPVIAGLSPYTIGAISQFWNLSERALPWVVARDKDSIRAAIRGLINDEAQRLAVGNEGRKFMQEVWSDAHVAKRLADFYESL